MDRFQVFDRRIRRHRPAHRLERPGADAVDVTGDAGDTPDRSFLSQR